MSKKLTQEEFEEKFYKKYQGQYSVLGKYDGFDKPVKIKCLKCNYEFSQTPNHYDMGQTKCPVCNKNGNTHITIIGVNDMWTTNKEVAKLLECRDDGYKYRINTDKKLNFICPTCHKVKKSYPRKIFENGFSCPYCGDGISYPNKFMANILDLLNIKFKTEHKIKKYPYRYDFYFQLNGNKYLIEMDGSYGHGCVNTPNLSIQEQIDIDKKKDKIAKDNGYVLFRIDCKYNDSPQRFSYVSKNIINSELNKLLHIEDKTFIKANELSQQSNVYKFARLWNNDIKSYDELSTQLHVCNSTIKKYAKQCIELGLINCDYNTFLSIIRLASNSKLAHTKGNRILCEQTKQVFYSISDAERKMNLPSLRSYFYRKGSYCGTLEDGTKLTWRKISEDEYQKYLLTK